MDANPVGAHYVARRIRGDALVIDTVQAQSHDWLQKVDVVAFMGAQVDRAVLKRCLDAGKQILIDARACCSRLEFGAIAELARAAPGLLHVGNPIVSLPSRQLIWGQAQHGKLGDPGLIRVHRWGSAAGDMQPQEAVPAPVLLYEIDNVLRYLGHAPQRVFATEYSDNRGLAVHVTWPGGAMAMIDFVSQLAAESAYASFSVIGSRGAAYADDHQNVQLLIRDSTVALTVPESSDWQAQMLLDFLTRWCNLQAMPEQSQSSRAEVERLSRESLLSWSRSITIADAVAESLRVRRAVEPKFESATNL
jgi:hypothetical protein